MNVDLFVGRAKPPENTATARTYGVISVALRVERDSGEIVAADVIMHSQVVRDFLISLLVGRKLGDDLTDIVRDIEEHYHSSSQRAVIQALFDASRHYEALVRGTVSQTNLRIADFSMGFGNAYLKYGMQAAKETATKYGAKIDFFDGQLDAATQARQISTALETGNYHGFIVYPYDSTSITPILQKAISETDILMAVFNTPLAGRDLNDGEALWEPGTVTFVGGQTHRVYVEWLSQIIAMAKTAYPDGGAAAAITGPKVVANSRNFDAAAKELLGGSGIDLVANEETDYTRIQAYAKARAVLAAHNDLRFFVSNYSEMTQGIVEAVEEAGLHGRVKIYDFGGSRWALAALRRGEIELTAIMLPCTESRRAVEALVDRMQGRDVPKFIDLTRDPGLPGTTLVTSENVDAFTAQYG